MALKYSFWVVQSPTCSSTPYENPVPAGPSIQSTLASLFQLYQLCLKVALSLTKTNQPLEQSQLCRLEQPGPGDSITIRGSFEGLPSEGVQTQQSPFPSWMSRQPAQKGLAQKPMGSMKESTQSPSSAARLEQASRASRISHFVIDIDIISDTHMILLLVLGAVLAAAQVSHEPIEPSVVKVHIGRQVITVPSNVAFSHNFSLLGYDIGGRIYETTQGLVDASLFDSSFYEQSRSCALYRSQLKMHMIHDIPIEKGWNLESIVTSDQLSSIFAIMSNQTYSQALNKDASRFLVRYQFNSTHIFKNQQQVSVTSLGLNSSEALDTTLVVIADIGRVIVTDGVKLASVDYHNFSNFKAIPVDQKDAKQYDYAFAEENDLLKFTLCHFSQSQNFGILFMAWNSALRVYHLLDNSTKAVLNNEFLHPTGAFFTDALPDHGRYWALTDKGQFVAFRPAEDKSFKIAIVQLQSQDCSSINKDRSTVHLICQQSGLKYVAELYLNESFVKPEEAFRLNRYYNQIDDARLMFKFGQQNNPKLFISGDNQLMVVPYAVNRQVLIDSSYAPRATRLRSLGVDSIHSLPAYSNFTHNRAIGVGEYFISLFEMVEEFPQMECRIMRTDGEREFNILVQLNSSSCVANGDSEQLQSICTYYFPFNIYPSLVEVDSAHHKTIVALVLALLLAAAIVVVGCGFYCRGNIERAKLEIRKKVEALKRKQGRKSKPI